MPCQKVKGDKGNEFKENEKRELGQK